MEAAIIRDRDAQWLGGAAMALVRIDDPSRSDGKTFYLAGRLHECIKPVRRLSNDEAIEFVEREIEAARRSAVHCSSYEDDVRTWEAVRDLMRTHNE